MKAVLHQYQESSVVVKPNTGNENQIALKQGIISLPLHSKRLILLLFGQLQYISYDLTKFFSIHSDANEGRAKAIGLRRTKDLV